MPCEPPEWYVHAFVSYGGCSHTTSKCDITPGSTAEYHLFWSKITHMLVFCIPSFCLHQCLSPMMYRTMEGIDKHLGDIIDPCPLLHCNTSQCSHSSSSLCGCGFRVCVGLYQV